VCKYEKVKGAKPLHFVFKILINLMIHFLKSSNIPKTDSRPQVEMLLGEFL